MLALACERTERIRLGAGIAYAWPRHPLVLAQQALTLAAASDGRFELGIGTGHRRMMEQTFGLPWDEPVERMLEYGTVLRNLLEEGRVAHAGRYHRVEAALWLAERMPVPILVGTLGAQMCHAVSRFADGIMTWLAPASYLASVVLPAAREGAEQAGTPVPRVVAAIPAALSADRQTVLQGLNAAFGGMARAPSYLGMLQRAGLAQPTDEGGWTEEMLDAVVAWGDESDLDARVNELADAGADELVLWPFPVGDDPGRFARGDPRGDAGARAMSVRSELAAEPFCYLTTRGRVTARPHRIEIWFALEGETLYLLSGGHERSDWVKNLRKTPEVTVELGQEVFAGHARIVADPEEDERARALVHDKYAGSYGGDLSRWRRTALPVAVDLGSDTSEGGSR